ncbi:NAD(+) synthase [Gephyromycinifex aptenodytis]|uniref:NAD(+) synthase n=1 Tax=Gephyromycinifex aptenodytis TaxID=2716227 RepID=UPI00144729B1|nr:NAD(+) synthase [Gephyromycinifex aptenodytis]
MKAELPTRKTWLKDEIDQLGRRGALVQLSGGIDSSVVLHLCAQALGPDKVVALYLPDSSTGPETKEFVDAAAQSAGVELIEQSIASAIDAQCPREEITRIIRTYAPEYDPSTHAYSVNASQRMAKRLGALVYQVVIGPRHGQADTVLRVSVEDLRAIIAYQNRKQRTRMTFAYAEAEARNFAVIGASNGDELDTGFVVKYGDDAADICAIGDLAKPEVYALARELGVPEQIIARPPTTDTFALEQTQEDYYYSLPADLLRILGTMSDEELADDAVLTPLLDQAPGWSVASLRQVAVGLRALLRYQRTRSLRLS